MHYDAWFLSRETLRYSMFELIYMYTFNHANGGITWIVILDLTTKPNDHGCYMSLVLYCSSVRKHRLSTLAELFPFSGRV